MRTEIKRTKVRAYYCLELHMDENRLASIFCFFFFPFCPEFLISIEWWREEGKQ